MQINKCRLFIILIANFNSNLKKINIRLCSRTTRQMAADHQWSADHRLRTAGLLGFEYTICPYSKHAIPHAPDRMHFIATDIYPAWLGLPKPSQFLIIWHPGRVKSDTLYYTFTRLMPYHYQYMCCLSGRMFSALSIVFVSSQLAIHRPWLSAAGL